MFASTLTQQHVKQQEQDNVTFGWIFLTEKNILLTHKNPVYTNTKHEQIQVWFNTQQW